MDIFNTYAVDEVKELNGTWVPLGDAKFLVARAGNKAYVKMLGKEVERNQKALDVKDEAADALSDRIMIDVIAETIARRSTGLLVSHTWPNGWTTGLTYSSVSPVRWLPFH